MNGVNVNVADRIALCGAQVVNPKENMAAIVAVAMLALRKDGVFLRLCGYG